MSVVQFHSLSRGSDFQSMIPVGAELRCDDNYNYLKEYTLDVLSPFQSKEIIEISNSNITPEHKMCA